MAKYTVVRTDTADAHIHKIILYIAEEFGTDVALEKLDELEGQIMGLADNSYLGMDPRYMVLRRQGYKVLVMAEEEAVNEKEHKKKNYPDVECAWNYGYVGVCFKQFGTKVCGRI